jgi:DNA-binding phage protein
VDRFGHESTRDRGEEALAFRGPEPFEVQEYLKTPEERAAYHEAILEDGDADLIAAALG